MDLISIDGVYYHEDMVVKVDNETPAQVVTATPNRAGGGTRSPKPTAKPTTGMKAPPFVPEDPKKYLPKEYELDTFIDTIKHTAPGCGGFRVVDKVEMKNSYATFKGKYVINATGIADVDVFVDDLMGDLTGAYASVSSHKALLNLAENVAHDNGKVIGATGDAAGTFALIGDKGNFSIQINNCDYKKVYKIDCDLDRTMQANYTRVINPQKITGALDASVPKPYLEGSEKIKVNDSFSHEIA